jgi:hypothetical protein
MFAPLNSCMNCEDEVLTVVWGWLQWPEVVKRWRLKAVWLVRAVGTISYGGEVVVGEISCGGGLIWLRWRSGGKKREKVVRGLVTWQKMNGESGK